MGRTERKQTYKAPEIQHRHSIPRVPGSMDEPAVMVYQENPHSIGITIHVPTPAEAMLVSYREFLHNRMEFLCKAAALGYPTIMIDNYNQEKILIRSVGDYIEVASEQRSVIFGRAEEIINKLLRQNNYLDDEYLEDNESWTPV